MTVVSYHAAAETDLVEIWLKIADEGGLKRADEYISKLQKTCVLLANEPEMGVERREIDIGVRSFPVGRYLIYYELIGSVLAVLRIWHTAQDPESLSMA